MGYNIEDAINKIFQVCWLLTSGDGEQNGYVGGWGEQMLWEGKMLEDLYGTKAESELTKTQNSQVNDEQKNLVQLHI